MSPYILPDYIVQEIEESPVLNDLYHFMLRFNEKLDWDTELETVANFMVNLKRRYPQDILSTAQKKFDQLLSKYPDEFGLFASIVH